MKLNGRSYKRLRTEHDSIYAISPKQANPRGQEVSWWLSGEGDEVTVDEVSFGVMGYSGIGWRGLVQDSKYTNHTEVYILNESYLSKLL